MRGRLLYWTAVVVIAATACGGSNHDRKGASPVAGNRAGQAETFITVGQSFRLEVRSIASGQVIRTLGTAPGAVAVSPDGSTIYYQGEGRGPAFPIFSVPVTGGEPVQVGSGSAPAVSPDGTRLAFAGPDGKTLGLYDTVQRLTSTLDLSALVGANASLNNTGTLVTWVTNDLILVVPLQNATMAAAAPRSGQSGPSELSPQGAIVVDLTARQPARGVTFTSLGSLALGATALGDEPDTILVGSRNTISRLKVTPASVSLLGTMKVPGTNVQIQALSPDGRNVLYLQSGGVGSPPPTVGRDPALGAPVVPGIQLWEGTIGTGVTGARPVIEDARLYQVAW